MTDDTIRADWQARGKIIERLQRTVHRQRQHINRLRALVIHAGKAVRMMNEEARRQQNLDEQNRKLRAAIRGGAAHGICLEPGEDRLEAMTLIVQNIRNRNMEQYRALSSLSAAALLVFRRHEGEMIENEYERAELEDLTVAIAGAQNVLSGDKSNLQKELDRMAQSDINLANQMRLLLVSRLIDLEQRVGPVRKRDLRAIREALAEL